VSTRLLLVLLCAVGLVAFAVRWQSQREARGEFEVARPLFDGVEFEHVRQIRISNISRGSEVCLQRDSAGTWYITDPVAYRADAGLIELLRQAVEGNLALTPPDPTLAHDLIGLAPPHAEFSVTELVDGESVTHELLVGVPDPTGSRVYALQEGSLILTSRNLVSTLDKDFTEFRSRRISQINPSKIVELHRTGKVQHSLDEEPYSLELSAWREGTSWRSLQPLEAALDPMDVSLVSVGAGRLVFDAYVEEPDPDLRIYGLAEPEVRIELKGLGGASEVFSIGRPAVGGSWFCMRGGTDDVYLLGDRDAVLLTFPFEAMIDRRLIRVAPGQVSAVRLERHGGSLRLSRERDGWVVSEDGAAPIPAEALAVRTLMAWVAEAELLPFDEGTSAPPGTAFERSLVFEVDGRELGGVVGAPAPSDSGEVVWYRRLGDEVTGRLDDEVVEWIDRPVSSWWSLSLLELDELQINSLVLTRGDEELRFSRGSRGRWRDERGREVSELLPWLDPLLFLRATDRVMEDGALPLDDEIGVRFEMVSDADREFALGRGVGGGTECAIGPVRAVLLRGDLYEGLSSLFP
jgi:hypothetical protein